MGSRREIDPDAGDVFEPCHYALVNCPRTEFEEKNFWVKDGHLQYGESQDQLSDFTSADYVLFSVAQSASRGDVRILPFYPLFEAAMKEASSSPETDSWERAKADLSTLYQLLILSPDLTPSHADALNDAYVSQLKLARKKVLQNATLGTQDDLSTAMKSRLRAAVEILDLD